MKPETVGFIQFFLISLIAVSIFMPPLFLQVKNPFTVELARTIYTFWSYQCHQMASRSFFLFGYPLSGCQRCVSIWISSFFTMLYLFFRKDLGRTKPLGLKLFIISLLPMLLDGGTQMLGWRTSDPFLRVMTGSIYGIGATLFFVPLINQLVTSPIKTIKHIRTVLGRFLMRTK